MVIGVDAGCLGIHDKRLQVGVYQVAKNLFEELGKIDKKNKYVLYSFYPIERGVMKGFGERMENRILNSKGWLKIQLPFAILKNKVDIFLGLSQAIPGTLPFSSHPYTIGFMYDIAFQKFPNMYFDSSKKLQAQTDYLIKNADKIIAISETTKKDIIHEYKINSKKIDVLHLGVSKEFNQNDKKYLSKNPYFLYVGALKPIKNVPTIIQAFSYFVEKTNFDYELYIVGGDKWLDEKITITLQQISPEVKNKIYFLGYVDNEILTNLYRGATVFISPNFYEGFGLTFLEAMISGCPVIGSTAGSIPEVVGEAGILVNSQDEKAIGEAMVRIVKDKKLRNELVKEGINRSKKFSWEKFGKGVLEIINKYNEK